MKKEHRRKITASIVITVLFILYYAAHVAVIVCLQPPWYIMLLGVLIPLAFVGVLIAMLHERIKEIRSGEQDDLSKY